METPTSAHLPASTLVGRLLPSLALVIILPLAALGVLLWHQHQQRLDELIREDADEVDTDLRMILDLQADGLATAIRPFAADPAVRRALGAGDMEELRSAWQPVFSGLRGDGRLSHLYVHDVNRTCRLRLHDPAVAGDRIDRHSLREAERTRRTASGLELGRLGTLTLRVVEPVMEGDRVLGYVELGMEVEGALRTLLGHMDSWNQVAVLINKERLDQATWEATQRRLGRQADWERMPGHVLLFASQGQLAAPFAAWADPPSDLRELEWNSHRWRVLMHPLRDGAGTEIGHILALRDVTTEHAAMLHRLAIGGAVGLLLPALVLAFVYHLLRRADRLIAIQQATLRDERWRLGNIIEATRAGTWEWDVGTGQVQVSERWAQILGHTCLDLGRFDRAAWEARIHPDDLATTLDLTRRHLAGERPFIDHEYRVRHQDGRWIWIHCRGRLFSRSTDGASRLMFGTHTDISQRKQAEEDNRSLEQQKAARAFGEMVHADRLVALGTLMAGLAHEFNHPAQVMLLNQKSLRSIVEACATAAKDLDGPAVGLLSWNEVAETAPQMLEDMEIATTQLSELIANVQLYARPNEGLCHGIDRDMLLAVAGSSLRLVRAYARRRQVTLVEGPGLAAGGRPASGCGCLQQVVVNLLLNAIQASRAGDRVVISGEQGDGRFGLTVSDSGPGIPPEVASRLGQPFVTTRAGDGGNGLGLFICLQIVGEQGGRLELTPCEPRGTLARVSYPEAPPA
jgi:PAS domain S-box-containing protein